MIVYKLTDDSSSEGPVIVENVAMVEDAIHEALACFEFEASDLGIGGKVTFTVEAVEMTEDEFESLPDL